MRWCLSTPGSREYVHPVAQSTSITPVSPSSLPRSLTMYLEAVIKRVEWCSWRPGSSELRDALGDRDWVNPEMHREAGIERVWGCTCRLWSSGIGGVHASGRFGGRRDGSRDSIHWLSCNCGNVESTTCAERWETGWEWETVDLGMMLYLVYAVLCVNSWLWHGEIESDDLTSCS